MRRTHQIAAALLAALLVCVGLIGATAYDAAYRPGPLTSATTVVIPKGATVGEIAARLRNASVIASPLFFRLWVKLDRSLSTPRAGEYLFAARIRLAEVLSMLRGGRTVARKLTVPEGLTAAQVVALIENTPQLEGEISSVPAEGRLLPETYHFSLGDDRAELLRRMTAAMDATLRDLWAKRSPDLPLKSPLEAVTLASIVEKETSLPEERPRIAAVFINRLQRGMRLQADPTVAYALSENGGEERRPLTQTDLQTPTRYNTYMIDGLPPGPIANPGHAALAAVLRPAATNELFFVANGAGGHAFASTLEEHNRNVARWRQLQRQGQAR